MLTCVNCSAVVTEDETRCPTCGRNPRVKVVALEDAPPPRSPEPARRSRRWPLYVAVAVVLLVVGGIVRYADEITEDELGPRSRTLTSADGAVALVVPEKWRETTVVKGADVQASDPDAAEYVAAISVEPRPAVLSAELDVILEASAKRMLRRFAEGDLVGDPERLEISGYPAIQQRVAGSVDEVEAVMLLTIAATEEKIVYVFAWTSPGNFLAAQPVFDDILSRIRITDESVNA